MATLDEANIPWRVRLLEDWRASMSKRDLPLRIDRVERTQQEMRGDISELKDGQKTMTEEMRTELTAVRWTLVKFGLGVAGSVLGASVIFALSILAATGKL